jgi:hypothetical protein
MIAPYNMRDLQTALANVQAHPDDRVYICNRSGRRFAIARIVEEKDGVNGRCVVFYLET